MRAAAEGAESRWRREAALRRKAHNWALELAGNVRVFARIRPVLDVERRQGSLAAREAVVASGEEEVLVAADTDDTASPTGGRRLRGGRFAFDRVFGGGATQEEVFEEVEPLAVSCLDGYNATIFAYGQTGSGKTYTIQGDARNPGVSLRTLRRLLELARERSEAERRCFSLELSVLEVYNEDVRDLLAGAPAEPASGDDWRQQWLAEPAPAAATGATLLATQRAAPAAPPATGRCGSEPSGSARLEVRRDPSTGGTHVPGLTRVALRSVEEAGVALRLAAAGRAVGAHSMNEHSSRSHLVLTVHVTAKALGGQRARQLAAIASKLHIIDLAGSERVSKTDATGARLQEAKAINKSLSALGNVMEALAGAASEAPPARGRGGVRGTAATPNFVPYRSSKLTFLLEDSLRGGSKVLMFANVSPSRYNAPESTTCLQFAQRCRAVQLGRATKAVGASPASRH